LAIASIVVLIGMSLSMAAYSWYLSLPPSSREAASDVDLISQEMVRVGATTACLDTDGVWTMKDAAGVVVAKFDLAHKVRPGRPGGEVGDGRAYPHREDIISATRIVKQ